MKDKEPSKVYLRLVDNPDNGTTLVRLVADPPREEWDEENLTPSQKMALIAMGAMIDAGTIIKQKEAEKVLAEAMEVRSFDVGNN